MRHTWDIFCQVIDNYGDIGVTWRLARQLVKEHELAVRLWVDDLHAFKRIWPEILVDIEKQYCQGVEIRLWSEAFPPVLPARVIIEAFGCALPPSYLAAMSAQSPAAVWINLEYLSAEAWVKTHHGLPSPHPTLPLTKFFFFPGYEKGTGGVLCERGLARRRERFQRIEISAFWQRFGLEAPIRPEVRVSLFGYQNSAIEGLLDVWAKRNQPVTCLIPEGSLVPKVAAWLGESALPIGTVRRCGGLEIHILPFLNQDDYDRLLWACDINFVRGEDSCVRAQWTQKPFVWQPYPQSDNAHWSKLEALSQLYVRGLPKAQADAIIGLWMGWSGRGDLASAWPGLLNVRTEIDGHARRWAARLAEPGDLAGNLVAFVEQRLGS